MEYKFRMTQNVLEFTYENAKGRMDAHPDIAENMKSIIQNYSHYNSEKDALETAIKMEAKNPYSCQIWAKVEKSDDIYRIVNWWIVTDDIKVKLAAEYIGMAQMYDETRLQKIIDNYVKIDDVNEVNESTNTYVYKKLTEPDKKNIKGKWSYVNVCQYVNPKGEHINLPGGLPPLSMDDLDGGNIINTIISDLFGNIDFKDNGEFVFKYDYDKEGKGTYINDNKLPLCMTFYINEIPVDINCSLTQNVTKSESYIFIDKPDVLKLSMVYIYQQLITNNMQVTQEDLTAFYEELLNSFNELAIAVSLQRL